MNLTLEEAAEAVRAGAVTVTTYDEDDQETGTRTLIHTFAHTSGMALGADWDLDGALEFIGKADSARWVDHPLGHDLEVRGDGRLIYFALLRPT